MTPKDHPVWNKMAVPTRDILEEAMREIKRREKIEKWRQLLQSVHTKPRWSLNAYRSLPVYVHNT